MLILQQLHNISDESLEYQINDRLLFMRFLHLGIEERVPDATTLWLFRQQLTLQQLIDPLFEQFDRYLRMAISEAMVIKPKAVKSWMPP
jgi:IS5 family transposase